MRLHGALAGHQLDAGEVGKASVVGDLLGVALMPAGLAGIAVALAWHRNVAIRAVAAIAGLLTFFPVFVVLEGIAKGLVGDAGPSWLPDESGILATGAALAACGLLAVRAGARRAGQPGHA